MALVGIPKTCRLMAKLYIMWYVTVSTYLKFPNMFAHTSGSIRPQSSISSACLVTNSPFFSSTFVSLVWIVDSNIAPGQSCSSSLATYSAIS